MGIIRPEGRFVRDNGNVIILSIFLFEGRNLLILLAPLEELLMKVKFIVSRGLCEGHVGVERASGWWIKSLMASSHPLLAAAR